MREMSRRANAPHVFWDLRLLRRGVRCDRALALDADHGRAAGEIRAQGHTLAGRNVNALAA